MSTARIGGVVPFVERVGAARELVLHLAARQLRSSHRRTALGWTWPLMIQIVQGACGTPGTVAHTLPEQIRTAGSGIGTLDASLAQATSELLDGTHSVSVRRVGSEDPAAALACAGLPNWEQRTP